MAILKWCFCFAFLAVALSGEVDVPAEPKSVKIGQNVNLEEFFPEYKAKTKALMKNLSRASSKKGQVAIVNDYTDDLLFNLNNFITINGLDPVPMPDIEEGFEWRILLITYHGVMALTDGWLQGLGTIERRGDVTVEYSYPNVQIHIPVGFNYLAFNYDYKAQFMGLGPTGGVDGKVDGCRFTVDIDLNMVNLRMNLDGYRLNSLGSVSLRFTGNILVDWMVNIFTTVTIPFVKPVLRLVIQGFVKGGMEIAFDFYNGMICQVLADCPEDALMSFF